MSWMTVDDAQVLRRLSRHPVRVVRAVMVDLTPADSLRVLQTNGKLQSAAELLELIESIEAGELYELLLMDTEPAAVFVFGRAGAEPVGAYVWAGGGEPITSTKDQRLVDLATSLAEAYERGKGDTSSAITV